MIKYSGLCVGGPMDGEWYTTHFSRFDVDQPVEKGPVPLAYSPLNFKIERIRYEYTQVGLADGATQGFWFVKGECSDLRYYLILHHVLKLYSWNAEQLRKYKEKFGEI